MPLTQVEKNAVLEAASSELKFLFGKEKANPDTCAELYHAGITTVRQFAVFASDVADLKEVIKTSFGIDAAAGLAER
eukprot:9410091-Lingulodinium_polyedra.AAC.1